MSNSLATRADGRFPDLGAGGRELADALTAYGADRSALVLGIVRGGVRAAFEVARTLHLPLDLLLLKPLIARAPGELLRAASVAGTLVIDEGCQTLPPGSVERLVVDDGVRALDARAAGCRGPRPATSIAARTILLIDNGLAYRSDDGRCDSCRAHDESQPHRCRGARRRFSAVAMAGALADRVHCLVTPASLGNVAMAYRRFDVPDDAQSADLLDGV